jgi:galactoside O-acetyltransferase
VKPYGRKLLAELTGLADWLLAGWPGHVGYRLRRIVLSRRLKAGAGASIGPWVEITGWRNITVGERFAMVRHASLHAENGCINIGTNVGVGANSSIDACDGGRITIGDDVLIAQNVVIRASNHAYDRIDLPICEQGHTGGTIVIEHDVWIGANAVVTPDVRIGAHSIVGAGAVVTESVAPYSVVGGVPARLIRMRVSQREPQSAASAATVVQSLDHEQH